MSQIDYSTMSDQELKQYFLEHRSDEAALTAYLARRKNRASRAMTKLDDPDFDTKILASIRQQMNDFRLDIQSHN